MAFDPLDSSMAQDAVDDIVDAAIENNEVVLFMKGTPAAPQCGFSERAIRLISDYRPDVHTVDVLQSTDEFRAALERHSGWETTPQAFVDGSFVGGSDILAELADRGDLADELNADGVDTTADDAALDADIDAPF
ncbi:MULTISPECIES: glutaredoxin family protein [Halobacterium]|uniref:Glutaredoxin n=5 Tax=Halobacterium salinarum TaxID=2242 RepID=A0A510N4P5_HALSA|nr:MULTISPECIES: glutaredoxin [Halobacterium]MBB6089826.1 monothiol glutaredoxin [Halobacterium salinarum]MCF2164083.1 glutaredoxin [Halobacterium salinarum]MCF2167841.1 glutaredoxin [Halobacterium salinarum]MCF2207676.1 glutaredoxin [Halobacterium salinarum]MCF2239191.1 glutaredoxin [Halobacterium salinarum]